jgi:uncharacterized protein (DUF433 family)
VPRRVPTAAFAGGFDDADELRERGDEAVAFEGLVVLPGVIGRIGAEDDEVLVADVFSRDRLVPMLVLGYNQCMATFKRITFNPEIMGGKACIRGMRVTVGTVLGLLAAGRSREEILEAYPYLEPEDIGECLGYGVVSPL